MKTVLNLNLSFRFYDNEFFINLVNLLRAEVLILERIKFNKIIKERRASFIKRHVLNNLRLDIKILLVLNF